MTHEFKTLFDATILEKKGSSKWNDEYDYSVLIENILSTNKINSQIELDVALIRAAELWQSILRSAEGDELSLLADLINDFDYHEQLKQEHFEPK